MIRVIALLLMPLGAVATTAAIVRADDFELTLKVDPANRAAAGKEGSDLIGRPDSKATRSVSTKKTLETPSEKKPAPRPVVKLTGDEKASVSWHAENTSQAEEFENVLVHFFVVKEKETGQRQVPKLTADVTYEGALTMDFKPHDTADWKWTLNIHEPGSYLLRVETIGMGQQHGHEHYAAMDLIVE